MFIVFNTNACTFSFGNNGCIISEAKLCVFLNACYSNDCSTEMYNLHIAHQAVFKHLIKYIMVLGMDRDK